LLEKGTFLTLEDAKTGVFEFMESYYNCKRRHSALGYLNPPPILNNFFIKTKPNFFNFMNSLSTFIRPHHVFLPFILLECAFVNSKNQQPTPMNLHSKTPFWLIKNGLIQSFPALKNNLQTDVAIIGAGITGALVGYHLAKAGVQVALLERRHAGMGSTSASTALLQYEIDTHLTQLTEWFGEEKAARSYHLCLNAIWKLQELCKELQLKDGFELRPSLYYASRRRDVKSLKQEYELRRKHGIELEFLEKKDLERLFPFSAPAALLSKVGGQVDAYQMAHALLNKLTDMGGRVHNQTEIKKIRYLNDCVELTTEDDCVVRAKRLVIAAGYESQHFLQQKVEIVHSSYAIVSEPMPDQEFWHQNCLIWETARPYLYVRTTSDNRILAGGRDEPFYNPDRRDRLVEKKAQQLEQDFKKLFPDLPFKTDFRWAGTFSETKDGLPYIGVSPERPLTYFALGFGGNGITFSLIAAEVIRDLYLGKKNDDAAIFAFERKKE
jgi:glycine/D-amino acid oxidase-like deaminating enzyme